VFGVFATSGNSTFINKYLPSQNKFERQLPLEVLLKKDKDELKGEFQFVKGSLQKMSSTNKIIL